MRQIFPIRNEYFCHQMPIIIITYHNATIQLTIPTCTQIISVKNGQFNLHMISFWILWRAWEMTENTSWFDQSRSIQPHWNSTISNQCKTFNYLFYLFIYRFIYCEAYIYTIMCNWKQRCKMYVGDVSNAA